MHGHDHATNTSFNENTIKNYISDKRIYNDFLDILKIDLKFLLEIIKKYEQEYKRSFDDIIGDSCAVKLKNVDKQLAIKLWCNQDKLWDLVFKDLEFKDGESALLAFWGNYYFVNKLREKFPKVNFYQMEESLLDADYITGKLVGSFLDGFINIKRSMKFDKIIMNPPYNGNLHLKTLDATIKENTEAEIVNLSSIRWLQDPLAERKTQLKNNKKTPDYFSEEGTFIWHHIKELQQFLKKETNEAFGTLCEPIAIYHCSNKEQPEFKADFSMAERMLENVKRFYIDMMKEEGEFVVPTAHYHWSSGDEAGQPFGLCLSENGTYVKSGWTKGLHDTYEQLHFKTENEAENFKKFLQSKVYQFVLGKLHIGKRLSLSPIPMMPTYTHPWTDEDLYKYFNLTSEEISMIETEIK